MYNKYVRNQPRVAHIQMGFTFLGYNRGMIRALRLIRLLAAGLAALVLVVLLVQRSSPSQADPVERIRAYTRGEEFDYLEWMLDALWEKNSYAALSVPRYLDAEQQKEVVYAALDLTAQINRLSFEIARAYADPEVTDPAAATVDLRRQRDALTFRQERLAFMAEAILQTQVAAVAKDLELTFLGQPVPPVLYHITPLPYALIVSPRDRIEQEANLSLLPGMALEERVRIEDVVAKRLDKSTLVVGIGGVGVYPTMVMSTTDLNWLSEVVAHEWIHNFLTLRPLGINYMTSPELRTINETTANIAGKEIGREVMRRYYPERLPPEENPEPEKPAEPNQPPPDPPPFNFRKEMRETRLTVDDLLAQGKVVEAEQYMEARRRVFWENGYQIRKLNQAYFAFFGAYNDAPGGSGEAGKDPVGPAVQELRKRSASLAEFLNRISWVTSFEGLQALLTETAP